MSSLSGAVRAVLVLTILNPSAAFAAGPAVLDLATAERLALEQDRSAPALRAAADAMAERAVAQGQLPDPRLRLGAANFPTDTFDRDQEPMTQLQVGVQQAFPPGDTLPLRRARMEAMAQAGGADAEARMRMVRRQVREQYLELWYQRRAGDILTRSRGLFEELREVTESQYSAGRKHQQDVLQAGVELALLEDRATRIDTEADRARAALARLIGAEPAARALADGFPALPPPVTLAELERGLPGHPEMRRERLKVDAGQRGVELARERYKPGWMLDVTYGNRAGDNADGSARSDFLSAMVLVDLPLFTDRRQDRVLAAERQDLSAAQLRREDVLRELERGLAADYAEWTRLGQRLEGYERDVLPRARENAAAALNAYQSGVGDFSAVMRARLTELDSRLTALRLRVDRARAQARLLYLQEETP